MCAALSAVPDSNNVATTEAKAIPDNFLYCSIFTHVQLLCAQYHLDNRHYSTLFF